MTMSRSQYPQCEYSVPTYCSKTVPKAGLYSATSRGHFSSMKRIERISSDALRTGIPNSSPIFKPMS